MVWEMEDRQMAAKYAQIMIWVKFSDFRYALHRQLFKKEYFLLRTQMLARHNKEIEQAQRIHQAEEEDLIRTLNLDRKKLPKILRLEAKTRSNMFKESLRISAQVTFLYFYKGNDINNARHAK
jgi:STE20-like kinase